MAKLSQIMSTLEDLLALYDYSFPSEAVAQAPAHPRDAASLLVYERHSDQTHWAHFRDLQQFLPSNSVLVLNNTKVLPARLSVQTDTGKTIAVLYLRTANDQVIVLANKKLQPGQTLYVAQQAKFKVVEQAAKEYILEPLFPLTELISLLEAHGVMPLPPYIKQSPLTEKERQAEYQTVFAKKPGSIAAPTASLHFTPELLTQLEQAGITFVYITLHVNLGTFSPLSAEQLDSGRLHEELYDIPSATAEIINQAKQAGRPIIAVGTTVTRALETATTADGHLPAGSGLTDLFIQPGYDFKTVTGLITNFHVPKSSLLMLVAALVGRPKLLALYEQAIARQFKLFSFGDSMLIL